MRCVLEAAIRCRGGAQSFRNVFTSANILLFEIEEGNPRGREAIEHAYLEVESLEEGTAIQEEEKKGERWEEEKRPAGSEKSSPQKKQSPEKKHYIKVWKEEYSNSKGVFRETLKHILSIRNNHFDDEIVD